MNANANVTTCSINHGNSMTANEYTPPAVNTLVTVLPGLVPIFALAGVVNALAGVLFECEMWAIKEY